MTESDAAPQLQSLLEAVRRQSAGTADELWLVGGIVRDLLADRVRRPLDVDVAVRGDAVAFARALAERTGGTYVPLAEDRGTVRVVVAADTVVDVSTTLGRPIADDLARRDYTINAMALPLAPDLPVGAADLIDPFGGMRDLDARVVRMVSARSLEEDPLRLLRAFRFAATLELTVDPATLGAIRARAHLAADPAPERTARELFLTLGSPAAGPQLRLMDDAGVLQPVLPEVARMRGVGQNDFHHLDVWMHSLESLTCLERLLADLPGLVGDCAPRLGTFLDEQIVPDRRRVALLKLATLLHDAGKPSCREMRDGKVIFYGHTRRGADITRDACERLRLSSRETAEAWTWVDRHLVPADLLKTSPLTDKRAARFFRRNGESGLALLLLSLADGMATRGPASDRTTYERMRAFIDEMSHAYYGWAQRRIQEPPLVDGRDLMAATGLPQGRELGRIVRAVREAQLEGTIASRDEAVAYARDLLGRAPTAP